MIRLGIDTGGTYTDAVIVQTENVNVLAKAKALTTKGNLTAGIKAALDALPVDLLQTVEHVALSTTLATNACVEGKGGRARLIIVGTTDEVLHRVDAQNKFGIPYEDVLPVEFVGSYDGSDVTVPDWEALYQANRAFFDCADSFGIASIYALNNGAVVEKDGAAYLRQKFGKLVVEATTIAAEPNVIGRGATALLNARLVPIIGEFLDAVTSVFADLGLNAPVSIVRSDGTLMSERLARIRPVETILSGPASSVAGAQALAGTPECLVVDMGGTTSDISIIHGSHANRTDGISIGGWKTQVAGILINTAALGGDTVVRYTKNSRLELGTRRVTPLCVAATRWPQVTTALKWYLSRAVADQRSRYELLYLARDPGNLTRYNSPELRLLELLAEGPVSLYDERSDIVGLKLQRLEDEGIVMRCGMTPTDAMHIRGDFRAFDVEASQLGAQCLLKSYRGIAACGSDQAICDLADEIYDLAGFRMFTQVLGAFAQDRYWPDGPTALDDQMAALARGVWDCNRSGTSRAFEALFQIQATLVGVGAPTHVFLPQVAQALGAPMAVPDHAEVANAVGAAMSRISVEQQIRVHPLRGADGVLTGYQVRSTDFSEVFNAKEDALAAARERARQQALEEASRRGASGDLACELSEDCSFYEALGVGKVVREWVITARVG